MGTPCTATLSTPRSEVVFTITAPPPVATRKSSSESAGQTRPSASATSGTRRMTPSRSGLMVMRPRPAANCSSAGMLRTTPGNRNSQGRGSSPMVASIDCSPPPRSSSSLRP